MQASAESVSVPRVYFLDLEVSHVPVDQGEPRRNITQICLYDPLREKGQRVFEAHVKPPKQLRHDADEVSFQHGRSEKPKYEFKVVWPHLKKWVNEKLDGKRFAVIVGHNIYKHDWKILENECARIQEAIPKYWKPFCTLYLAGALGVPKGERSLSALCQRYQVKHLDQHDAYNDVRMLVNVFGKMTEGADMGKLASAMVLPPREHPVREVASLVRGVNEAVLVFFDFEATGLFKKGSPNPRAIELAAYIPSTKASFCTLIDPGLDEGIKVPEVVVRLTGISEQMIRASAEEYQQKTGGKLDFKAVWTSFEQWMDREIGPTTKKVAVLAGHNIWNYDLPLYKSECERFGMKSKWWKSVDTLALSRHLYKGHKPQPKGFHRLQELRKRMGIAENNAHRALGDVMVNHAVWECFVDGVDKKNLSKALLSRHPITSTGQLVREEGGTFRPDQYMEVPSEKPAAMEVVAQGSSSPEPEGAVPVFRRAEEVAEGGSRSKERASVRDKNKRDQKRPRSPVRGLAIPAPTIVRTDNPDQTVFTLTFQLPKPSAKKKTRVEKNAELAQTQRMKRSDQEEAQKPARKFTLVFTDSEETMLAG